MESYYRGSDATCALAERVGMQNSGNGALGSAVSGELHEARFAFIPFVLGLVALAAILASAQSFRLWFEETTIPRTGHEHLVEGSLLFMVGWQALLVAARMRLQLPRARGITGRLIRCAARSICNERTMAVAALVLSVGCGLLGAAALRWLTGQFASDPYSDPVKWLIVSLMCVGLGTQTLLGGRPERQAKDC